MRKIYTVFAAVGLVMLSAFSAYAVEPQMHPILKDLVVRGEVEVEYLGHARGMDAWVVRKGPQTQYAYQNKDGALIMSGFMFGDDPNLSITQQFLQRYKDRLEGDDTSVPVAGAAAAQRPAGGAEEFYRQVEESNWVRIGDATAPIMYVFINPTCSHCKDHWKKLQSYVDDGVIQVRLVPFGRLETNRISSAALLSVSNPGVSWRAYVDGDMQALGPDKVKEGMEMKVEANSVLAETWKLPEPPFTLYKSPGDNKIKVIRGIPENMMLMMADFAL